MLFPNVLITLLCLLGKIILTHSEAPASKYKKILKPCFSDDHLDKNDDPEHCTADSCPKANIREANKIQEIEDERFRLVRLEGVKVNLERFLEHFLLFKTMFAFCFASRQELYINVTLRLIKE